MGMAAGETMDGMAAGETMDGMAAGETMDGMAAGETMDGMAAGETMDGMADGETMDGMTGFAGFDVTIVGPDDMLLAETATGNSADRIMNPDLEISGDANPRLAILAASDAVREADHPDGYSLTDDWVAGYAHVLNSFNNINESDRIDADDVGALDWVVVVQQPTADAYTSLIPLETLNEELATTSSLLTLVLAGVAVLALAIAVGSSLMFSRRITKPIQKLRDAAVHAADVALPSVVAQIDEMGPDDEIPSLDPVQISTGDEVEDLAHSFNTVQQTAADLAVQQARLRRQNVAATFVSMGRRNQNLLSKQLEHINAMEQNEGNSKTLRRLFQLDHLATRMRRNAESLLVLAGEETPRRFRAPVSVRHLVQAAGGEIEEFSRIEMGTIDEAAIEGGAASDIAHLLAELLENASRFSPPTTRIQIHGRRRAEGSYSLSIVDEGLGMEDHDLQTANMRLTDPVEFDRAPSAYLGLFVVGHLARRHELTVRLAESTFGGITATVEIPAELLVAPTAPAPEVVPVSPFESVVHQPDPAEEESGYVPELVPETAYDLDSDPWLDEPQPPAQTEQLEPQSSPARAEAEVPVDAATVFDTMPGMPLTTTMPISIPMAEAEVPVDEVVMAAPPPQWGRNSEEDEAPDEGPGILGTPPLAPSIPPPPPPPPLPPPPPPVASVDTSDPVVEPVDQPAAPVEHPADPVNQSADPWTSRPARHRRSIRPES